MNNHMNSDNIPTNRLLFDVREVERLLGISHSQLYRELQSGRLRSCKIGRLRRISRTALVEYVAQLAAGE